MIRGPTNAAVDHARRRVLDICGMGDADPAVARLTAALTKARADKDDAFARANAAPRGGAERESLFARAHDLRRGVADLERELAGAVFASKNRGFGPDRVDLHGLSVEDAEQHVRARLAAVQADLARGKLEKLTIITGAGHHSGPSGPRIRPAVVALLQQAGFPYAEDEAGGQLFVYAKGSSTPAGRGGASNPVGEFLSFLSSLLWDCLGFGRASSSGGAKP